MIAHILKESQVFVYQNSLTRTHFAHLAKAIFSTWKFVALETWRLFQNYLFVVYIEVFQVCIIKSIFMLLIVGVNYTVSLIPQQNEYIFFSYLAKSIKMILFTNSTAFIYLCSVAFSNIAHIFTESQVKICQNLSARAVLFMFQRQALVLKKFGSWCFGIFC